MARAEPSATFQPYRNPLIERLLLAQQSQPTTQQLSLTLLACIGLACGLATLKPREYDFVQILVSRGVSTDVAGWSVVVVQACLALLLLLSVAALVNILLASCSPGWALARSAKQRLSTSSAAACGTAATHAVASASPWGVDLGHYVNDVGLDWGARLSPSSRGAGQRARRRVQAGGYRELDESSTDGSSTAGAGRSTAVWPRRQSDSAVVVTDSEMFSLLSQRQRALLGLSPRSGAAPLPASARRGGSSSTSRTGRLSPSLAQSYRERTERAAHKCLSTGVVAARKGQQRRQRFAVPLSGSYANNGGAAAAAAAGATPPRRSLWSAYAAGGPAAAAPGQGTGGTQWTYSSPSPSHAQIFPQGFSAPSAASTAGISPPFTGTSVQTSPMIGQWGSPQLAVGALAQVYPPSRMPSFSTAMWRTPQPRSEYEERSQFVAAAATPASAPAAVQYPSPQGQSPLGIASPLSPLQSVQRIGPTGFRDALKGSAAFTEDTPPQVMPHMRRPRVETDADFELLLADVDRRFGAGAWADASQAWPLQAAAAAPSTADATGAAGAGEASPALPISFAPGTGGVSPYRGQGGPAGGLPWPWSAAEEGAGGGGSSGFSPLQPAASPLARGSPVGTGGGWQGTPVGRGVGPTLGPAPHTVPVWRSMSGSSGGLQAWPSGYMAVRGPMSVTPLQSKRRKEMSLFDLYGAPAVSDGLYPPLTFHPGYSEPNYSMPSLRQATLLPGLHGAPVSAAFGTSTPVQEGGARRGEALEAFSPFRTPQPRLPAGSFWAGQEAVRAASADSRFPGAQSRGSFLPAFGMASQNQISSPWNPYGAGLTTGGLAAATVPRTPFTAEEKGILRQDDEEEEDDEEADEDTEERGFIGPRILPSPSQVYVDRGKGTAGGAESGAVLVVMSPDDVLRVMAGLGVLPFLSVWRDAVRQWFGQHLLQSLLLKIDQTPREVVAAAAALGLSFQVSPLDGSGTFLEAIGTGTAAAAVSMNGDIKPAAGTGTAGAAAAAAAATTTTIRSNTLATYSPAGSGSSSSSSDGRGRGRSSRRAGGVEAEVEAEGGERVALVQGTAVAESEGLAQLQRALQQLLLAQLQQQAAQQPSTMVFHLPQLQQQQQLQQQLQQLHQREQLTAAVQRCAHAVREMERLKEVLTGRWGKGLLPAAGMPLEYAVRRIRDLAQGSCISAFKWDSGGSYTAAVDAAEAYATDRASTAAAAVSIPLSPTLSTPLTASPSHISVHTVRLATPGPRDPLFEEASWTVQRMKGEKEWSSDLPTDAHLLAYLFCVHLAHPDWFLAQGRPEPFSPADSQQLFVGAKLPAKTAPSRRFLGIVEGAQGALGSEADVLVVTRDVPPVFGLFWDKQLQFSSQGHNALWDAIIILAQRIRSHHTSLLGLAGDLPSPHLQNKQAPPLARLVAILDPKTATH